MYNKHPCFNTPPDETMVWRYMNFPKFLSLLEESSLFFSSANKLAEIDPYEGSYARGNIDYDPNKDPNFINMEPKVIEGYKNALKQGRTFSKEKMRRGLYINAWYINDYESAAMWKCYAENNDGIAIQSTVGKLKESLSNYSGDIYIGEITYIDYEKSTIPEGNIFFNFIHKRKSFEHEKELRAVFMDSKLFGLEELPSGVGVPVDKEILIEKVFISPNAPEWMKKLIQTVTLKYLPNKKIIKSDLNNEGLW